MKLQSSIVALSCLLLMLFKFQLIQADLNSDKQALLAFASSVPHGRKLNWDVSSPVCNSWFGITCNSNGTRVISIRLPGVGLIGSIPENTIGKLDALTILSLRSNYLTGTLPSDIPSIPSIQFLFLQYNNFSGPFPDSLSPKLVALDISSNSFSGNIPTSVKTLRRLTWLNLQSNSFSGAIPDIDLPRLKLLNLSNNNLNGSIPHALQTYPRSSFMGNSLLCGLPLSNCSSVSISPAPTPSETNQPLSPSNTTVHESASAKKFGIGSILALAIGGFAFICLLVVVFSVFCLKRRKSEKTSADKGKSSLTVKALNPKDFSSAVQDAEKNKLKFFEDCNYTFNLEDLLRASAEVLGKGSYGTTYKAVLEDGTAVLELVVRRLREVAVSKKEFEQQMEIVGKVGHNPHVVSLRAYYYSKDEKLLVYNYMPGGSLFNLLHGNRGEGRTPFDWDSRMKIMLGTAKGVAFIHSEGGPKFTHGNIKSTNVLITEDLDGCLTDVGLASMMNFPMTKSRATGYRAPEVTEAKKITHKSDVYSFGVLLLELLTGKTPLHYPGYDDVVDLPRWVRSVVHEEWTAEVFDLELLKGRYVEEEMVQMLQIALACVVRVPDMRPTMDQVVQMIEEVRQPELKNRTSSESESNLQTP